MSNIINTKQIDAIGTLNNTGKIILKIFDHLDWEDEKKHLFLLQDKINNYLTYIESGQIYEKFPNANNVLKIISISFLNMLSTNAIKFLDNSAKIVEDAGFKLTYSISEPNVDFTDIKFESTLSTEEELREIDEVNVDKGTGLVWLKIYDEFNWDNEDKHLYTLQTKINTYLQFIESTEVIEAYPNFRNGQIVLWIDFLYKPNKNAINFISKLKEIINDAGYQLTYTTLENENSKYFNLIENR